MEEITCAACKKRVGNYCKDLDQRLELLAVETELEFKRPKECDGGQEK